MVLGRPKLIKVATIGFILASILVLKTSLTLANDDPLSFGKFTALPEQPSRPVKVRLADRQTREFATVLQTEAQKPVNFAGHFILASWGCGASCIQVAAIDARNGSVTWLPFTVCCWPRGSANPLDFQVNSRLLVVHGSRDEKGRGTYDYVLDKGSFRLIKAEETVR